MVKCIVTEFADMTAKFDYLTQILKFKSSELKTCQTMAHVDRCILNIVFNLYMIYQNYHTTKIEPTLFKKKRTTYFIERIVKSIFKLILKQITPILGYGHVLHYFKQMLNATTARRHIKQH